MTTEPDEKGSKAPEMTDNDHSAEEGPNCSPGCGCGDRAGKGKSKIKIAVFLVAVVAIGGILLFKTTNAKQTTSGTGNPSYSAALAAKGKGPVFNSAGQKGGSGASLSAIAELNTVAAKLDTVFLVIPSKDNAPTTKETGAAVAAVERSLNAKGLSTGIYTLQTASPDYSDVASKVKAPGIAVLTKSGGIGFVSGGISETNLMQAYVAATRGSGCCPPSGGKPTVPCN